MRKYNMWAGNPNGDNEDLTKCVKEVSDSSGWHSFQCNRNRGFSKDKLYCEQHTKKHPE